MHFFYLLLCWENQMLTTNIALNIWWYAIATFNYIFYTILVTAFTTYLMIMYHRLVHILMHTNKIKSYIHELKYMYHNYTVNIYLALGYVLLLWYLFYYCRFFLCWHCNINFLLANIHIILNIFTAEEYPDGYRNIF